MIFFFVFFFKKLKKFLHARVCKYIVCAHQMMIARAME